LRGDGASLALRQSAGKYIAISHELAARLALLEGDLEPAQREIDAARTELSKTPCALVEWKVEALAAQIADADQDDDAAETARQRAMVLIERIAAGLRPEERAGFISSKAVLEVSVPKTMTR
jgi:hypothetical protein